MKSTVIYSAAINACTACLFAGPIAPPLEKTVTVPPDFEEQNFGLVNPGDVLTLTVTSPKGILSASSSGGAWRGGLVGDRAVFTEYIEASFAGVHRGRFFGTYKTDGDKPGDPPKWEGKALAAVLVVMDDGKQIAENATVWITKDPAMPKLSAKLDPGLDGNATWQLDVRYTDHNRNDTNLLPANPGRVLPANQVWDIKADFGSSFYGGTSKASVSYGGGASKASLSFKIRGKNPTLQEAKDFIIAQNTYWYAPAIGKKESQLTQFDKSGLPLFGPPNGFGMFQLDNPVATVDQVWNWKANVLGAISRMPGHRSEAAAWIARQVDQQTKEQPKSPLDKVSFAFGSLTYSSADKSTKTPTDACSIQKFNGATKWVIYWKNLTPTEPGAWSIQADYRSYVDGVSNEHTALGLP